MTSKGLVISDEAFIDNSEGYTINGEGGYYFEISEYSSDSYALDNLVELPKKIYAPKWYKDAYESASKEVEVSFDKVKDIPNANYEYTIIENLKINGVAISPFAFYDTEQDILYATSSFFEADKIDTFGKIAANMISSRREFSSFDDIQHEVYEDLNAWKNFLNKKINVSELLCNISSTLEKDDTFIVETISFDHENKKIMINDTYTLGF